MNVDDYKMDIFIEKIVARKKTTKDKFSVVGVIFLALILFFALGFLPDTVQTFTPLIIAAIAYGAYYLIKSKNIEYEYAVTNGEIDVDKIISQKRRKRLLSTHCKNFEILARVKSTHYNDNYAKIQNKIFAGSTMDSDDLYFAVFQHNNKRTILYFEPSDKMIKAFRRFIPGKMYV